MSSFYLHRCDTIQHVCNFVGAAMQRVGLIVMAFRGVLNRATVKLVTCMGAALLSGFAVAQQVDPADLAGALILPG